MSSTTTRADENKTIVSRAISDVVSGGDYELLHELYADDFVHYRGTDADLMGPAAFREWMEAVHAGFSDFEAIEEFSIAEGDYVASRVTYTGTHDGEFMDIPATGRSVTVTGNTINRIRDGKIAESWPETDFLGLLRQVGVLDSPTD
jgi:steroid delta-isomerase-like uncharacterized protein